MHSTVNVDDTVLLVASMSIVEIEFKLDRDLNSVRNWMQTTQITLNIKVIPLVIPVLIVLIPLRFLLKAIRSKRLLFLYVGIVINENLSWNDHIEHIVLVI